MLLRLKTEPPMRVPTVSRLIRYKDHQVKTQYFERWPSLSESNRLFRLTLGMSARCQDQHAFFASLFLPATASTARQVVIVAMVVEAANWIKRRPTT